ncbi:MAG: hypothetical protein AAF236_11340 [Verrucomicrobiota bacterium]
MKTTIVSLLTLLAFLPLTAQEGGDAKAKGKGRPGGVEFLKKAEKNGDGKLSQDEVPEQAWERLSRLDTDNDGAVSMRELAAARTQGKGGMKGKGDEPGTPGSGRPDPGEMFARGDTNGDGKISEGEVPAESWERLSRADANNDGGVTREELAAAMRARAGQKSGPEGQGASKGGTKGGGSDAIFGRFDADEDGKLSKDEVSADLWSKITKADTDADGLVSKEELKAVYDARSAAGGGYGPKPDAPKKKRPELEAEEA